MFNNKSISAIIGTAFVASLSVGVANATDNPFSAKTLSAGYQVADNHADKAKDGKCGEGKCGTTAKEGADKAKDGKCGEGKCGTTAKEGADKAKDGKCGEGKCGH